MDVEKGGKGKKETDVKHHIPQFHTPVSTPRHELILMTLAPRKVVQTILCVEPVFSFREKKKKPPSASLALAHTKMIRGQTAPLLDAHPSRLQWTPHRSPRCSLVEDTQSPVADQAKVCRSRDGEFGGVEGGEGKGVAGEAVRVSRAGLGRGRETGSSGG